MTKRAGYAAGTEVPVERSRAELDGILERFGAEEFGYHSNRERALVGFLYRGYRVQLEVRFPDPEDREIATVRTGKGSTRRRRTESQVAARVEQVKREKWRALVFLVKAKLVAIEEGASSFEAEFLPYLVVDGGARTILEAMEPQLETIRAAGMQLPEHAGPSAHGPGVAAAPRVTVEPA